jgi:predicted transcriptional regulator
MLAGLKPRRSRLELYLEVLNVIKNGTEKPTRIMYEANLSWTSLKGILSSLETQDLVEMIDVSESRDRRSAIIYRITEKGEHLMRYFRKAEQLLDLD